MKRRYEAPKIVDERYLEVEAMACNKVPGLGAISFCGQVWMGRHGNQAGCQMNPNSRSS